MRAGQFSANFDPDLLDAFRSRCREKGEKYTKVLEQLAKLYLDSDGGVFDGMTEKKPPTTPSVVTQSGEPLVLLERRIERLEADDLETGETFTTVFERIDAIEKKLGLGKYSK